MLARAASRCCCTVMCNYDVIVLRGRCGFLQPAPLEVRQKAWDTCKPLSKYFKELSKIVLLDDDDYKVRMRLLRDIISSCRDRKS